MRRGAASPLLTACASTWAGVRDGTQYCEMCAHCRPNRSIPTTSLCSSDAVHSSRLSPSLLSPCSVWSGDSGLVVKWGSVDAGGEALCSTNASPLAPNGLSNAVSGARTPTLSGMPARIHSVGSPLRPPPSPCLSSPDPPQKSRATGGVRSGGCVPLAARKGSSQVSSNGVETKSFAIGASESGACLHHASYDTPPPAAPLPRLPAPSWWL
mmetsp:Transcript_2365/g.4901  ORF Transcript_2365/g.4901 Transcript_2365/m.4901 type:complete len:211 (-) Transcript_2365:461-1093(-)